MHPCRFQHWVLKNNQACDWMARFPDSTKLVHMNLPRTHNTATLMVSHTLYVYLMIMHSIPDSNFFRCQEKSIFQSLDDGVHIFDLCIAYSPSSDTIGFHHSAAMLAPHTTIEDVFFSFYNWLDDHPTEAVLVSINFEGGTSMPNNVQLQTHLYDI
ncbi:PLC-like phosphodiesterase [Tricholoma matsutake]|nr:PLC-like phosphodiesterase [Tricholoma matsutake 945]